MAWRLITLHQLTHRFTNQFWYAGAIKGVVRLSELGCVREGTRVSHAKFQVSRSIPSYTYFLQKLGGGPYYP